MDAPIETAAQIVEHADVAVGARLAATRDQPLSKAAGKAGKRK